MILLFFDLQSVSTHFLNLNKKITTGWQISCTDFTEKAVIFYNLTFIRFFNILYWEIITSFFKLKEIKRLNFLQNIWIENLRNLTKWVDRKLNLKKYPACSRHSRHNHSTNHCASKKNKMFFDWLKNEQQREASEIGDVSIVIGDEDCFPQASLCTQTSSRNWSGSQQQWLTWRSSDESCKILWDNPHLHESYKIFQYNPHLHESCKILWDNPHLHESYKIFQYNPHLHESCKILWDNPHLHESYNIFQYNPHLHESCKILWDNPHLHESYKIFQDNPHLHESCKILWDKPHFHESYNIFQYNPHLHESCKILWDNPPLHESYMNSICPTTICIFLVLTPLSARLRHEIVSF